MGAAMECLSLYWFLPIQDSLFLHSQDGEHYHFTTREAFESGIERGDFLEHAHVHANIYGTSVQAVRALADDGRCCVLDIDVQGARQVCLGGVGPENVWCLGLHARAKPCGRLLCGHNAV